MQIRCKHYMVDKCKKDNRTCIFSEKCFEEKERPLKTNAERIRAMSDEELVKFFGFRSLCNHIQRDEGSWCEMQGSCPDCIAEWLRATVKE